MDPFGGSGTTLDACRHLNWRCLILTSLQPARDEIVWHDISGGFPEEAKGCDPLLPGPALLEAEAEPVP